MAASSSEGGNQCIDGNFAQGHALRALSHIITLGTSGNKTISVSDMKKADCIKRAKR